MEKRVFIKNCFRKGLLIFFGFIFISSFGKGANASIFNDIEQTSDYAKESVISLAEKNIINGTSEGYFNPKGLLTRAEMITIIVRGLGIDTKDITNDPTFKDVPKSHWAYKYVEVAYKEGMIKGVSPNEFAPELKCTREQMAKMIMNSLESTTINSKETEEAIKKIKGYNDYNRVADWALNEMALAVQEGIIKGTGNNTLNPEGYTTREQIVVVTDRFFDYNSLDEQEAANLGHLFASERSIIFSFEKPVKNVVVRKVTNSKGEQIDSDYKIIYDRSENLGNLSMVENEFIRAEVIPQDFTLHKGESYSIYYSYILGGYNEKIIYKEQMVTVKDNEFTIESIISLNASQIRVGFTSEMEDGSALEVSNYNLTDELGNKLIIKDVKLSPTQKSVILNLDKPIRKQEIDVLITDVYSMKGDVLNYHIKVDTVDDRTAPYIISMNYDYETSMITLVFSEPVYSGTVKTSSGVKLAEANGEKITFGYGYSITGSYQKIYVQNLSDGFNVSQDPNVRHLPIIHRYNVPSVIDVGYTKDSTGRVKELIVYLNETIPPDAGYSGQAIAAFDKYGRSVYAQAVIYDEDNNRIVVNDGFTTTMVCYTSRPVKEGESKVIHPIADSVNIYNGKYTFNFLQYDSIWVVDFSKSEAYPLDKE